MNWKQHADHLRAGETVSFRPKGNSMRPRIESGNLVTVSPDISQVAADDVVFCRVKGNYYVHLVLAVKAEGEAKKYLIGNNRRKVNGWTSSVFGKVIKVGK